MVVDDLSFTVRFFFLLPHTTPHNLSPLFTYNIMHAYLHTYVRTYVRARVCACVRVCVRACVCASCVRAYVHILARTYARMHNVSSVVDDILQIGYLTGLISVITYYGILRFCNYVCLNTCRFVYEVCRVCWMVSQPCRPLCMGGRPEGGRGGAHAPWIWIFVKIWSFIASRLFTIYVK